MFLLQTCYRDFYESTGGSVSHRVPHFPSCQVTQTSVKFVSIRTGHESAAPVRSAARVPGAFCLQTGLWGLLGGTITDSACTCQLGFAATGAAHFIPERTGPAGSGCLWLHLLLIKLCSPQSATWSLSFLAIKADHFIFLLLRC